jgi:hypothetical protein
MSYFLSLATAASGAAAVPENQKSKKVIPAASIDRMRPGPKSKRKEPEETSSPAPSVDVIYEINR